MTNQETSIEIGARLAKAREDAVSAVAGVDTAQTAYAAGLLTGTPTALRKLAEARADAAIRADQASAVVSKLEADLDLATEAEAEASRREQYAAACALAEAARKQLFDTYPRAAEQIRAVLRTIGEADIAVAAANENLPQGANPIADSNCARSLPNLPEEMISEEIVELWALDSFSSPLPEHRQKKVQAYSADPKTGFLPYVGSTSGGKDPCTLRTFRRTERLPAVVGRHVRPLADEVQLPGLAFGEGAYWKPSSSPGEVLRQLSEPRRPAAVEGPREPVIEYLPVRNP